jgi:hypothetical protein
MVLVVIQTRKELTELSSKIYLSEVKDPSFNAHWCSLVPFQSPVEEDVPWVDIWSDS